MLTTANRMYNDIIKLALCSVCSPSTLGFLHFFISAHSLICEACEIGENPWGLRKYAVNLDQNLGARRQADQPNNTHGHHEKNSSYLQTI